MIDETHDPGRTSWVESANGHGSFPIQNIPFGVFSPDGGKPRGGVAIGEKIFDISAALEVGLFSGAALDAAQLASGRTLNAWLEAGRRRGARCGGGSASCWMPKATTPRDCAGSRPAAA